MGSDMRLYSLHGPGPRPFEFRSVMTQLIARNRIRGSFWCSRQKMTTSPGVGCMNRFWGVPNKGNHQMDGLRGSFPHFVLRTSKFVPDKSQPKTPKGVPTQQHTPVVFHLVNNICFSLLALKGIYHYWKICVFFPEDLSKWTQAHTHTHSRSPSSAL